MSAPMVFSIRRAYVARIISGTKLWEFRKRTPSVKRNDMALIYEARGRGWIVAAFTVGLIVEGTPKLVWDRVAELGGGHGLQRDAYDSYFGDRTRAVAIELVGVLECSRPLPAGMRPPQSWARLKEAS